MPIVRETGGLKDTVIPYNEYTGEGNGFSFANINAHEFLFVTKYAADLYRNHKDVWNKLIKAGMKGDYSWKKSAAEYAFGRIEQVQQIHLQSPFNILDLRNVYLFPVFLFSIIALISSS